MAGSEGPRQQHLNSVALALDELATVVEALGLMSDMAAGLTSRVYEATGGHTSSVDGSTAYGACLSLTAGITNQNVHVEKIKEALTDYRRSL